MAAKPKKFDWGDGNGAIHNIPLAQHTANMVGKGYTPQGPPAGSFDPSLEANLAASGRGLSDLISDTDPLTGTQGMRNTADWQIAQAGLDQQRARGTEDYNSAVAAEGTGYQRSLGDLLQARTRGGEDYQTNLKGLSRQYQQLGDVQLQTANKAGAAESGGAYAQAAQKRAANQAIDQAPIDTAYQRFTQDSSTQEGRLSEDDKTNLSNLLTNYTRQGQDIGTQGDAAKLAYDRSQADLTTGITRAQRENTQLGVDTAKQEQYQAGTPTTYAPPASAGGATKIPGVTVNGKPLTSSAYNSGALYQALLAGSRKRKTITTGVNTP